MLGFDASVAQESDFQCFEELADFASPDSLDRLLAQYDVEEQVVHSMGYFGTGTRPCEDANNCDAFLLVGRASMASFDVFAVVSFVVDTIAAAAAVVVAMRADWDRFPVADAFCMRDSRSLPHLVD